MTNLTDVELAVLYGLQALRTPFFDEVMVFITSLGDQGRLWILTGALLLCTKKTRKTGLAVLLSLLIGFLIGNVWLKNLFERQRPCWIDRTVSLLIPSPKDFSFPSGHSMVSFEGAFSIWLRHKKLGIPALALAAMIAFSRLYLFVHFPTDVLTGSLLGIGIAWAVYRGISWKETAVRRRP